MTTPALHSYEDLIGRSTVLPPVKADFGGLGLGVVAGEVAVAAAGGDQAAPEWIRVTPRGTAGTRDGRSYSFDPEKLVARFAADAVDVAVDTDHGLALRAVKGERVDAVGYAAELQARPDGTYARVTWNDGGRAVLAARTHRYVSPTFHHDEAGRATWLHSISLVAAPALSMPALLHALGHTPEPSMKRIAAALGLPETADEAACLAALGRRTEVAPIAAAL
ncbi:phage protease, partial [uncultured Methylobacterium sp.]|uniref:phage protease n=1 Tax=uncultured Methylobacterium sp. TaxID=157278 RepID=UPI00258866A3